MGKSVGKKVGDWGEYVFVKTNAPTLLDKEIKKLKNHGSGKEIWLSSVTDPYQGLEAGYQVTRKCLDVLIKNDYRGLVSILTKSDLILRDIDLYKKLPKVDLGLTITTTDDSISRFFEKFAPPVSARLKALTALNRHNLPTYAFVGPLFPHIIEDDKALEKLFSQIHKTGTRDIYVEYFNPSRYIVERLKNELGSEKKNIAFYTQSKRKDKRRQWDKKVGSLIKKYGFRLRTGGTLYHPEMN